MNANAKFDGVLKIYLTADLSANSTNGSTSAKATLEQTEDTKLDLDIKSAVFEDISLLTSAFSNPNEKAATAVANANSEKVAVVRPKSLEAVSPEQNIISDAKDEKAFWDIGRCLYANVKLGRLLKDGAAMLENLSANAECTPGNLALKDFVGKLYSAEFSGSANLSFDKSRKAPYNLANTRISLKNLESSKLFADSEKPMITGEFSAQLDLEGSGNNMKHLGAYLLGSASLSGSGGTLRLIDTSTQEGALTSIAEAP
ncbi:MAG: AsmA family protein [Bacilli bacterium]